MGYLRKGQIATSDRFDEVSSRKVMGQYSLLETIGGCLVTQSSTPAQTVDMAAGTALLDYVETAISASADFSVAAASGANPRWDLIYLNSSGTLSHEEGTAAAIPLQVVPDYGNDKIPLAWLYRDTSDNTIQTADIWDARWFAPQEKPLNYNKKCDEGKAAAGAYTATVVIPANSVSRYVKFGFEWGTASTDKGLEALLNVRVDNSDTDDHSEDYCEVRLTDAGDNVTDQANIRNINWCYIQDEDWTAQHTISVYLSTVTNMTCTLYGIYALGR